MTPEQAKQDMLQHLDRMFPNTPPLAKTTPRLKARVKPLPPIRAACDTLMDGDRLAAHITQCAACQAAGARLQVSTDGATWTNYTGELENVEAYAHVRCIVTNQAPGKMTVEVSRGPVSITTPWLPLGPVAPVKCDRGHEDNGSSPMAVHFDGRTHVWCGPCEMAARAWLRAQSGEKRPGGAALIDRRLVRDFGIEDPALPNV
jgi:hypothetical protein